MRNGLAAAERKGSGGKALYNARPEWEGEDGYAHMLAQAFADLVATRDKATKHVGRRSERRRGKGEGERGGQTWLAAVG